MFHQAGDPTDLAGTFAHLAGFFDGINRPDIAATLCGVTTNYPATNVIIGFTAAVDHVRNTLDTDTFDRCVATGTAMDTAEAVRYARTHIEAVRTELEAST